MRRGVLAALAAAIVTAALPAGQASAGGWSYDPAEDMIYYGSTPVMPWYAQKPWTGTATGNYYRYHPTTVPGYPERLEGYPVPIYKAPRRLAPAVVRARAVRPSRHVEWCAMRWRSYDVRTDSYQPYHGPRRICRSPFG